MFGDGWKQKLLFGLLLVGLLAVAGVAISPAFAVSCAILTICLSFIRKQLPHPTKNQKWLLAVLSVVAVVPGDPFIALLMAGIIAACFTHKEMASPQAVYAAGYGALAMLVGVGIFDPTALFAGTEANLSHAVKSIQDVAKAAGQAAPYVGYAAGAGFGGTGLVEIVKSKNGQGGDLGGGMKKLLVGGGLTGLTALLDATMRDVTSGSTAGQLGGKTSPIPQ